MRILEQHEIDGLDNPMASNYNPKMIGDPPRHQGECNPQSVEYATDNDITNILAEKWSL